jgi:hypothetical protein
MKIKKILDHKNCMYNVLIEGRHTTYVDSAIYKEDGWYLDNRHHIVSKVIAYQPLPPIPSQQKEGI